MKTLVVGFLIFTLMLGYFTKVSLVAYYHLNKTYIIAELCDNKSRPELKCEGKCYLKKKLDSEAEHSTHFLWLQMLSDISYYVTDDCLSLLNQWSACTQIKPLYPPTGYEIISLKSKYQPPKQA